LNELQFVGRITGMLISFDPEKICRATDGELEMNERAGYQQAGNMAGTGKNNALNACSNGTSIA
jgi:hypothetical protein